MLNQLTDTIYRMQKLVSKNEILLGYLQDKCLGNLDNSITISQMERCAINLSKRRNKLFDLISEEVDRLWQAKY